jgi:ribosomal protein S7
MTALTSSKQRAKRPAVEVFEQAMQNVMPQIEVGRAVWVALPIRCPCRSSRRQLSLAMRWLLMAARSRGGRSMAEKLANEFMDAATIRARLSSDATTHIVWQKPTGHFRISAFKEIRYWIS